MPQSSTSSAATSNRPRDALDSQQRGVAQYQRLASVLRHRIATGVYPVGQLLPAITQLATELNVAVVTVRQAYDLLVGEGLVKSQRGVGTHVAAVPATVDNRMRAVINNLRDTGEDVAIEAVAEARCDGLPVELQGSAPPSGGYVRISKIHTFGGEPFCYVEAYIPANLRAELSPQFAKQRKVLAAILDLVGDKDKTIRQCTTVAPADYPLCDMLRVPFSSPLARMTRRVCDAQGQVLYAATTWYRGDRYITEMEFPVSFLNTMPELTQARTRSSSSRSRK